jgi:hypothetical protein
MSSSSAPAICPRTWVIRRRRRSGNLGPAVVEPVAYAVKKVRAAGKVAGTLVTSDELPAWFKHGVRYFYIHSDPFLRVGPAGIKILVQ